MARDRINPAYLQPGTMVGPYEIVDLVGSGGFGSLYRVRRDEKTYALKLAHVRMSDVCADDRADREERLDREIAALKTLRHPNIVRVHCFERWPDLEDGFPYLVMDFVEGHRLYDWRSQTSPSLRRMCEVMAKVAVAVDYIHRLGHFHRDLKSENILVRRADGEPVIVDFGIARPILSHTVTRAQMTLGTISHYAPEYAAWTKSKDYFQGRQFEWQATTDLHSLGYVFYELLTGKPPFPRSENENEVLHAIANLVPTPPSVRSNQRVPGALDTIVMKLLEKQPEARYQTGRELAQAVREALDAAGPEWDAPFDVPDGDRNAITPRDRDRASLPGVPTRVAPKDHTASSSTEGDAEQEVAALPLIGEAVAAGPQQDVPGGSAGGVAFKAPAVVRPAFSCIGRAERSQRPDDPEEREQNSIPSAIRKQAERLAEAVAKPRRPPVVLVGGGLVAAVALLLVALAAAHPKAEPRKADLLADVEKQRASEAANAPAMPPAPREVATPVGIGDALSAATPQRDQSGPAGAGAATSPAAGQREKGAEVARGDSQDVGSAAPRIAAEPLNLGIAPVPPPESDWPPHSGRTTAGNGGSMARSTSSGSPAWLKRSQRFDAGTKVASVKKGRGVPLGTHLRAKLLSNLDSRTMANAPVEAMLATPLVMDDAVVLPARTMVYGQASTSAGRFTIRFSRLRLPDNTEVEFNGLALDRGDGKAGLVPARRIESGRDSGPGVGERVARGTANRALREVTGGLAQDIARGAGSEVVNDPGQPELGGGSSVILLDAPVLFDVFVAAAF
jgi:serine/threonine protein kinase